jgi:ribulose-phosphate 3-epimerase
MNTEVRVAASILAANHARLADDVHEAEQAGVDGIHIDVSDGRYTSELIFGYKVVADLRRETRLPFDVHLATYRQHDFVAPFIEAGADMIMFQHESLEHPLRSIESVRAQGKRVGIAFAPMTPFEGIAPYIRDVDRLNLLGVEPGIGGQPFSLRVLQKIERCSQAIQAEDLSTSISVDGGVNRDTVKAVVDSGADTVIIGSGIFNAEAISRNIQRIRENARR